MSQNTTFPQELMTRIEAYALPFLAQGRKDWDIPHTRAVVHYVEQLACAEQQDLLVLITAAWFHDIGYTGLFSENQSTQHASVKQQKTLHMQKGAEMAQTFFEEPDIARWYQPEQRQRVIHLVSIHDQVARLSALDELVLMEADTLGAIDLQWATPTFDYASAISYVNGLKQRRLPRFTTPLGKQYIARLLPIYEAYLVQRQTNVASEDDPT